MIQIALRKNFYLVSSRAREGKPARTQAENGTGCSKYEHFELFDILAVLV
jgi:hypothetical protein